MKIRLRSAAPLAALAGLMTLAPTCSRPAEVGEPAPEAGVTPLTQPWELYIPLQKTPLGMASIRASDCGRCHREIYAEWQATSHAVAYEDAQFQAEWKKDGKLWLCVNCHTPLANQRPKLVTGLRDGDFRKPVTKPNPKFDAALQKESITCAVCHVRDGHVIGAGHAKLPAHPTRTDTKLLSQALCEGCHNVQAELTDTLICTFNTGDEWRGATDSGAHAGKGCIDCHMPAVTRPMVPGGVDRPGRRHTWYGAGIAKLPKDVAAARAAYSPGYDVELSASAPKPAQGQTPAVRIDLTVTNARAGHYIPTGDPERYITLDLTLRPAEPADAAAIWSHTERIGELWEWHPKARKLSDNSLAPGERRKLTFDAPPDPAQAVPLVAEVVVTNHRMTEENARAMGVLGRYPLNVEVTRRTARVTLP